MEVLTVEQMQRANQATVEGGTSGFALMEQAGRSVAEVADALAETGLSSWWPAAATTAETASSRRPNWSPAGVRSPSSCSGERATLKGDACPGC